jgi:ATP-dependent RNA helicase DeaD
LDAARHIFGALEVSPNIARALEKIGYHEPTPIQQRCLPPLLAGKDVVGQAQTGTGKTAAFGIPMVEHMDLTEASVQGLVLVPTRELAVQVRDELARLAQFRRLGIVACYGGQAISRQISALDRRPQIIVGTPGRLLDHLSRGTLKLQSLRMLVLDEADEMLDIGFLPSIERILAQTPAGRQTALFSATMPSPIRRIVNRHMRSPLWVRIGEEIETAPNVCQLYYEVSEQDRIRALIELIRTEVKDGKVLLFRRTQSGVDKLTRALQFQDIPAAGVHGGMHQSRRSAVIRDFHAGVLKVLVATNVAARGLDIPQVSHVINYDMPQNLEEYVHRIGRTARMGRDGTAITFVTEWDFPMLDSLISGLDGELIPGTLSP